MITILYMDILFFLFAAEIARAADCSQTCFEPGGSVDGSLDPSAVADPDLFLYRAFHSSIVLGDHLYIDGGERTYTPNATATTVADLYTYSIDLSTSWTNGTVVLNQINKVGVPLLNLENLWRDPSNASFYAYNGELSGISYDIAPPANELWQFTPSGDSGRWSTPGISAGSNFTDLVRVVNAASSFGNGVGYALGGYQDWRTSGQAPYYQNGQTTTDATPVGGMVAYDMVSGSWSNITSATFTESGSFARAQLQYLPDYGDEGLLIPLGGSTSTAEVDSVGRTTVNDFTSISMYDIASGIWHIQRTSGESPPPRMGLCSVSVRGDDGTFEIFIYGGHYLRPERDMELDAVYVLSLPAFHWERSTYPPAQARNYHTCNVLGDGSRQMAVIGGFDSTVENTTSWRDPWPQGIGVFDLSDMEWRDRYDPSAEPYRTPDAIRDWYAQNGPHPSQWNDQAVQGWFTNTGSTNPPPDGEPLRNSSTGSRTGAIVGAVVGASLGVLLVAALTWFFIRRRRNRPTRAEEASLQTEYYKAELGADHAVKPRHNPNYGVKYELQSNPGTAQPLLLHELGQYPAQNPSNPPGPQKHELP